MFGKLFLVFFVRNNCCILPNLLWYYQGPLTLVNFIVKLAVLVNVMMDMMVLVNLLLDLMIIVSDQVQSRT